MDNKLENKRDHDEFFDRMMSIEGNFFEFDYIGFHCECVRNSSTKTWCGYVYLSNDHDLWGFYNKSGVPSHPKLLFLTVHGGITFSGADEMSTYWIIGFDCAHSFDLVYFPSSLDPLCDALSVYNSRLEKRIYRTKDFVIDQLKQLVDQLNEYPKWKRLSKIDSLV